jgi:hypothetical protein
MNATDDHDFDEQLRALASDPPPEVARRLRARFDDFRMQHNAERPRLARRRLGFGFACAAAAAVMAAIGLALQARPGFAQVASAVLKRPWVHVRISEGGRDVCESWYSPTRGISAWRQGGTLQYDDLRTRVYHSYDPDDDAVYRGPIVWNPGKSFDALASTADALKMLLQGGPADGKTLAGVGFFGLGGAAMKVTEQGAQKVVDGGKPLLEYRLTVQRDGEPAPLRLLFRVDEAAKLPTLCRIEGVRDGKPFASDQQFDFPEKGPADVYDLGAPRTAKLVDRIPDDDVDRILRTIRAGRVRMDDYKAVFAREFVDLEHAWWKDPPIVLYRKGNRFREDFAVVRPSDARSSVERPGPGVDLRSWWFDRIKAFQTFATTSVLRDGTMYMTTWKSADDGGDSHHLDVASVSRTQFGNEPGEIYPAEYTRRPEFICRPPLGVGDPHHEPTLDKHPAEGPAGCVLLTMRRTADKGRINEKGVGPADGQRFWLDPQRDYIVMRWDMVVRGADGQPTIHESDTIEDVARSPQGVWYATRSRRRTAKPDEPGKFDEEIHHYYVDFDVKLPDSMFDPPKSGRIY